MKGLEAWERIKKGIDTNIWECGYWDDIELIEKELKEYEKMKSIKGTTTLDSALEETLIKACPNVAKKLKALEIIKKYYYGNGVLFGEMTEEEINFLKEVLL